VVCDTAESEAALTGLPDEVIGKILWKNVAKLYGVDMPTSFSKGASASRQVLRTSGTTVN
jgi:hypothetical protein